MKVSEELMERIIMIAPFGNDGVDKFLTTSFATKHKIACQSWRKRWWRRTECNKQIVWWYGRKK